MMNIYEAIESISETNGYDGPVCMPSENIYDYLKGYSDPNNKTSFVVTGYDRSMISTSSLSFKVEDYGEYSDAENSDNMATMFYLTGKSRQGNVTVIVNKKSVLSICLGIPGSCKLFVGEREIVGAKTAQGKDKEIKIKVSTYGNTGRMKKIQQSVKNQLIELYKNLAENGESGPVDELLDKFYDYEVKATAIAKRRFNEGINDGYTDWSGYYEGTDYLDRLNKALNGFGRSLLFPVGNAKVSNDTLLVNMTSAAECPSRLGKTCLIGGACYAYADANFRFGIRHRDRMLHLANMICLCSNRMDIMQGLLSDYIDSAREAGYPIKTIRLNEAGDFINQQAIDEYAKMCAAIKKEKGVQATAYTVRTKQALENGDVEVFNYAKAIEKDENGAPAIVLTVSRADAASVSEIDPTKEASFDGEFEPVPAKFNGDECVYINSRDAADRFFMAIPKSDFDKLPDTPIARNGQPNLMQNDHFINDFNPGGWFHKCQCEVDKNRTCGDCHICYQPNRTGKKYFVLCKLHGTNAGDIQSNNLNNKRGFTREIGNNEVGQNQQPVQLQTWDSTNDAAMRNDAKGDWFKNNQALIKKDADREKSLKKVKVEKPNKLQKGEKAAQNESAMQIDRDDVVTMIKECINRLYDNI